CGSRAGRDEGRVHKVRTDAREDARASGPLEAGPTTRGPSEREGGTMTSASQDTPRRTQPWRGVIEEFRSWLPVSEATPAVTLGEGGTPLVTSGWLSELTGCDVRLKVEGDNPTCSFKD